MRNLRDLPFKTKNGYGSQAEFFYFVLENLQRQLEKQQQEQQQDMEKAQRQMCELRETLEQKTKTICALQAQVS